MKIDMKRQTHPRCGGDILFGGSGEQAHLYCNRCHAFTYDTGHGRVPSGADRGANQAAWDAGEQASPELHQGTIDGLVRVLRPEEEGGRRVTGAAIVAAIELAGGPQLRAHWLRHAGHNQWVVASDDPEAPAELRGKVVARSTNAMRIHPMIAAGDPCGYGLFPAGEG